MIIRRMPSVAESDNFQDQLMPEMCERLVVAKARTTLRRRLIAKVCRPLIAAARSR